MTAFTDLGLLPELLRALKDAGYDEPTPIQAKAIPVALRGVDVLGCAQTGTGKTAGFLLPVLQRLHGSSAARRPAQPADRAPPQGHHPTHHGDRHGHQDAHPGAGHHRHGSGAAPGRPRALILTPTRELAAQIGESAATYGRYLPLKSAVVFGGVGFAPQRDALRRGVDILVATPGRLLDHMSQGTVGFANLEILVLDEADRMLDMGFLPDVKRILKALPTARQTLFFSATMPDEIERLIRDTLKAPTIIEAGQRSRPVDAVRQTAYSVTADSKKDVVAHLLTTGDMRHVLVFTRTKARADRLARFLTKTGRRVAAIHGNKSQSARTQALGKFKSGQIDVLVATDIAARGIDVDGISHVINFDVPNVPEDYVHRIGRTARAESTGDAVSLVSPDEQPYIRSIERLTGITIPRVALEGFVAPPPTPHDPFARQPAHRHSQGGHPHRSQGAHHRTGRSPHGGRKPHGGSAAAHGPASTEAARPAHGGSGFRSRFRRRRGQR